MGRHCRATHPKAGGGTRSSTTRREGGARGRLLTAGGGGGRRGGTALPSAGSPIGVTDSPKEQGGVARRSSTGTREGADRPRATTNHPHPGLGGPLTHPRPWPRTGGCRHPSPPTSPPGWPALPGWHSTTPQHPPLPIDGQDSQGRVHVQESKSGGGATSADGGVCCQCAAEEGTHQTVPDREEKRRPGDWDPVLEMMSARAGGMDEGAGHYYY